MKFKYFKRVFSALVTLLFVGSQGCGFFGSRYSTDTGSGGTVQNGPATQLFLSGPTTLPLGSCVGPFRVEPRDAGGALSEHLPLDTQFEVAENSGAQIFTSPDCSSGSRATNGKIQAILISGFSVGEFYLSGVRPGSATLMASYSQLLPSSLPISYIPGAPKGLRWAGGRTISTFSCVETTIEIVDGSGTTTTYSSPMTVNTTGLGLSKFGIYANGNCRGAVNSVTIPANVSSTSVWVFASEAGDLSLTAAAELADWSPGRMVVTALNNQSPKLIIAPGAATAVSAECYAFNVDSYTAANEPFAVRSDTEVTIGAPESVMVYPNDNCSGNANRALTLAQDSGRTKFSTKVSPTGIYSLTATASLYLSGTSQLTIKGGAPATVIFSAAPSESRANVCAGPFKIQTKDAAGNDTVVVNSLTIALTHDSLAEKAKFYTSADCSTEAVSSVTVPSQAGNVSFYLKAQIPGSLLVTATPTGLLPITQRLTIRNSLGTPNRLGLTVLSREPHQAGRCLNLKLLSLDANGYPLEIAKTPLKAMLASDSVTTKFYQDSECQIEAAATEIEVGKTEATFSLIETKASQIVLGAKDLAPMSETQKAELSLSIVANVPSQLVFEGLVSPVFKGQCDNVIIVLKDAFGNETTARALLPIQLDTSNGFSFYPDCRSNSIITQASIAANESRLRVSFRATMIGSLRLVAVGPVGISAAYSPIEVLPAPPTHLVMSGKNTSLETGECGVFSISSVNDANQLAIYEEIAINLSTSELSGIFYSDPACNIPVSAPIPMSTHQNPVPFYVRSRVASRGAFLLAAASNDGKSATLSISIIPGPPKSISLLSEGPSTILKDTWAGPYKINLIDSFGNLTNAVSDLLIGLNSPILGAQISSVNNGVISPVKLPAGKSSAIFYLRASNAGILKLALVSGGLNSNSRNISVQNPVGIVKQVTPNFGPISGGTEVTILGGPFFPGANVLIGGVACHIQKVDLSFIVCKTTSHPAGVVDVMVSNLSAAPFVLVKGFSYVEFVPSFSRIVPDRGPAAGDTKVVISGSNFKAGAAVWLGGSPCRILSLSSDTISCMTSAHVAALVEIKIQNTDLGSVLAKDAYRYLTPPPKISSVSPKFGPKVGGTSISITGAGFLDGATINIGSNPCQKVRWVNASNLVCLTPPGVVGYANVGVTNPGSEQANLANGFQYLELPAVKSFSPSTAPENTTVAFSFKGTNFDNRMSFKIGTSECTSLAVSSATSATCSGVGQKAGNYPISLLYDGVVISPNVGTFTFLEGDGKIAVTDLQPRSGPTNGGTVVTVSGRNFPKELRIFLGNAECLNVEVTSTSSLKCYSAPHTEGEAKLVFRVANLSTQTQFNFKYTGNVSACECAVFAQISQACGDAHQREWGVAFTPKPANLNLVNGMVSTKLTPFLISPKHNPSGYFEPKCRRAPAQINETAFPETTTVYNQVIPLFTNGNLGSIKCPAYYSMYYSPLIVDLDDKGIALSAPNEGVRFDIEGDGRKQAISWPTNPFNSAFLILPTDQGTVESIRQLFGNNTVGPDGKKAANGFEALAKYDLNRDRAIDAKDAIFSRLRLWLDANRNGLLDQGESFSLPSKRVLSIDLNYEEISERNDFYGNETKQRSIIELSSGELRRILDIWFVPG